MTKIVDVEGIGETYAKKLSDAGITTVEALLEKGCEPKGRKVIAEQTGIKDALILKWINRADLARISGIGSEYADLLEIAGVDTVPELAKRVPQNLHEKMKAVNEEKNVVRKLPALSQVEKWVAEAKALPRIIEY
jgi:predicted flap endonuclease-1-like 5' DNA nuclease